MHKTYKQSSRWLTRFEKSNKFICRLKNIKSSGQLFLMFQKKLKGGTGEVNFGYQTKSGIMLLNYKIDQVKFCFDFVTEMALKTQWIKNRKQEQGNPLTLSRIYKSLNRKSRRSYTNTNRAFWIYGVQLYLEAKCKCL